MSKLEHREEMRHVISIKLCSAYRNKERTHHIFKRPAPRSLYLYMLYTHLYLHFLFCPYKRTNINNRSLQLPILISVSCTSARKCNLTFFFLVNLCFPASLAHPQVMEAFLLHLALISMQVKF